MTDPAPSTPSRSKADEIWYSHNPGQFTEMWKHAKFLEEEVALLQREVGEARESAAKASFGFGYYEGWLARKFPELSEKIKSEVDAAWAISKYTHTPPSTAGEG